LTAPGLMPIARSLEDVANGKPQNVKLLLEKDEISAIRFLVRPNSTFFFAYFAHIL